MSRPGVPPLLLAQQHGDLFPLARYSRDFFPLARFAFCLPREILGRYSRDFTRRTQGHRSRVHLHERSSLRLRYSMIHPLCICRLK
jgi:hypothetical protein